MPQPFHNAVITDQGIRLLTKAQAGESKIEFTRMEIGNGGYEESEKDLEQLKKMSSLKAAKNTYGLSIVEAYSDDSVKISALITNYNADKQEILVEQGYYINEIGLYAKEKDNPESAEILYSIAVTSGNIGDYMPPYNGFDPVEIIQEFYVAVSNAKEITIQLNTGAVALAEDLQKTNAKLDEIKKKVDTVDENANNYIHPTTPGNMHIPSGGSSGQVLKYGGSSGTAEWGESAANCVTLWQGVIYETGEWLRFYVPEQYWHNNNLTLMIDCVKYQYDESAFVNPSHSKTVMAALTLPHDLYVTENSKLKFWAYSAAYNQNGKVTRYDVNEKFSSDTDDVIHIAVEAKKLATTDYAEVSVFKSDARPYVITDIYAVIPQAQEQEG